MREIRFTVSSRKHRIGRAHVRFVLTTTTPIEVRTNRGDVGWLYVGPDDRGVVVEVIAVLIDDDVLLVIHAMPHAFKRGG